MVKEKITGARDHMQQQVLNCITRRNEYLARSASVSGCRTRFCCLAQNPIFPWHLKRFQPSQSHILKAYTYMQP
jgi:hypothetical protein